MPLDWSKDREKRRLRERGAETIDGESQTINAMLAKPRPRVPRSELRALADKAWAEFQKKKPGV